jgi:histone demethylase JARID1
MHPNGIQSPGFGGPSASPRPQGIFNDAALSRIDPRIETTLGGTTGQDIEMRDAFVGGSQGITRMFDELTNQDEPPKPVDQAGPSETKDVPSDNTTRVAEKERDTKWDGDDDMALFFDGD